MADTEIGGQSIRAGERVYMLWASAHRCLAAQLAQIELQIMLEEILRRMPDFHIDLDQVRHPTSVTIIWGRTALPATFTPASPQ
jgi:cytochrome P450